MFNISSHQQKKRLKVQAQRREFEKQQQQQRVHRVVRTTWLWGCSSTCSHNILVLFSFKSCCFPLSYLCVLLTDLLHITSSGLLKPLWSIKRFPALFVRATQLSSYHPSKSQHAIPVSFYLHCATNSSATHSPPTRWCSPLHLLMCLLAFPMMLCVFYHSGIVIFSHFILGVHIMSVHRFHSNKLSFQWSLLQGLWFSNFLALKDGIPLLQQKTNKRNNCLEKRTLGFNRRTGNWHFTLTLETSRYQEQETEWQTIVQRHFSHQHTGNPYSEYRWNGIHHFIRADAFIWRHIQHKHL